MEPYTRNSLPTLDHSRERRRSRPYYEPIHFVNRVARAMNHRLLLLYRSDPDFYVLGATGNVYTVNLSTTITCTCPDRAIPCKHILFVLIKVLGLSLDDECLKRRTLRPCQLARLLANPTSPESLAGPSLRERFHQLFLLQRELGGTCHTPCRGVDEGSLCPICLEEMGKAGDRLVACGTCRNTLHEECLLTWKRSQLRRSVSCVICRSRWRDRADQERYMNLAAYISEDDLASPPPPPPNGGGGDQGTICSDE